MRRLACILAAVLTLAGLSPALAAAQDNEPNGSCLMSQDTGVAGGEVRISGRFDLMKGSPVTDVDFFRFTARPGTRLVLGFSSFPLLPLRFAVFDERCDH